MVCAVARAPPQRHTSISRPGTAEIHYPIGLICRCSVLRTGDTDFGVSAVHNVGAVTGALQPSIYHLLNAGLAGSDVFTDSAPCVTGCRNALAKGAAIQAGMREIVVVRHIERMAGASFEQLAVPGDRRGRLVEGAAATASDGTRLIDAIEHLLLKIG